MLAFTIWCYTPILAHLKIKFFLSLTIILLDNKLMLRPSPQMFLTICNCVSGCNVSFYLGSGNCHYWTSRVSYLISSFEGMVDFYSVEFKSPGWFHPHIVSLEFFSLLIATVVKGLCVISTGFDCDPCVASAMSNCNCFCSACVYNCKCFCWTWV